MDFVTAEEAIILRLYLGGQANGDRQSRSW